MTLLRSSRRLRGHNPRVCLLQRGERLMDAETTRQLLGGLKKVRELLGDASRWTRGTNARAADDRPVIWSHPEACKWCVNGALLKVFVIDPKSDPYPESFNRAESVLAKCAGSLYDTGYIDANDTLEHPDVLKILDCAVTRAEKLVS